MLHTYIYKVNLHHHNCVGRYKHYKLADTPTPWGNFIQLITLHAQS